MATLLNRPVRRELILPLRGKTLIVELEPGDIISFREKGRRTRYSVSLHRVYYLALMAKIEEEYSDKMEVYRRRIKNGDTRLRKPRRPTLAVFNAKLRYLFSLK